MQTTLPEITNDTTVGQVVVSESTPTPSVSPTPVAATSPTPSPSPKEYYSFPLTIYGYGPQGATIELKGIGVSESVKTDQNGYFSFSGIYSHTNNYPELCLTGIDTLGRSTQPSCIPGLPISRKVPLEVGPIYLSPTVSLNKNKVTVQDSAVLTGVTSPNVDVLIYVLRTDKNLSYSFVPKVQAFETTAINTKSDDDGNFSLSLPTNSEVDFRIYAFSKYGQYLSTKSTTLEFSVLASLGVAWDDLKRILSENKLLTFIFVEIILVIILLILALKSTTKRIRRHKEGDFLKFVNSLASDL